MNTSDPHSVHRGELPEHPPASSWVDVAPVRDSAPPTQPDAVPAPTLDAELLRGAREQTGEAQALLAYGEPWNALAAARRARDLLDHAIRAYERAAFVASLADTAPRQPGELDLRAAE